MRNLVKIVVVCAASCILQPACTPDSASQGMASRADSLYISVRCVSTVTGLINRNFLEPGQKRTQYKLEYISETWPDTINPEQASRLIALTHLSESFTHLLTVSKGLQERSVKQLEQLKKLNQAINSTALAPENTLQYLTFESKCADTLNRVLDTLVKRSIDLSCGSRSL